MRACAYVGVRACVRVRVRACGCFCCVYVLNRLNCFSELLDAVSQMKTVANEPMFGPVVDGEEGLLKDNPTNLLQSGEFTDYAVRQLKIFGG